MRIEDIAGYGYWEFVGAFNARDGTELGWELGDVAEVIKLSESFRKCLGEGMRMGVLAQWRGYCDCIVFGKLN